MSTYFSRGNLSAGATPQPSLGQQQFQQQQEAQSQQHQPQQQQPQQQPPTPPPQSQQQLPDFAQYPQTQQQQPQPTYQQIVRQQYHYQQHLTHTNPYGAYFGFDFRMTTPTQAGYPAMGAASGLPPTPTSTQRDPPDSFSGEDNERKYTLKVVQEPIRARMCGFGDKDRRPITPPPCVLLEVLERSTGQPIDIKHEVNLVRHSPTSPSISATTASSYPPQPLPIPHYQYGPPMGHMAMGVHPSHYGYAHQSDSYGHPPPHYGYSDQNRGYHYGSSTPITPTSQYAPNGASQGALLSPSAPVMITQDPRSAPTGMFTRNLIGSLSVSAFKLADTNNKLGIWFILQDLSVRTEGSFRLKFSFVNVGSNSNPTQLNTEKAPVLATCFSQQFQVFSAKKFPGVIESTPLSKCFATQGIKIPIRKDGNGRMNEEDD